MNKEIAQKFVDEISVVCAKFNIGIVATCASEGIYGEITLVDLDHEPSGKLHPCGWYNIDQQLTNKLQATENGFDVRGIR